MVKDNNKKTLVSLDSPLVLGIEFGMGLGVAYIFYWFVFFFTRLLLS